jgi:hypothetical protein
MKVKSNVRAGLSATVRTSGGTRCSGLVAVA